MRERLIFFKRILADRRFDLALAGVVLAIIPLGAIARGTEHYIPAFIVAILGLAYLALAVASEGRARENTEPIRAASRNPGSGGEA